MKTPAQSSLSTCSPRHWLRPLSMRVERETRSFQASSEDGQVRVQVQGTATGIFVERSHVHHATALVVVNMHFDDAHRFGKWCDADPARFVYPMLFLSLKRHGSDLFP